MNSVRTLIDPTVLGSDLGNTSATWEPIVVRAGGKVWPVKGRIRYNIVTDKNKRLVTVKASAPNASTTTGGTMIHGDVYNIWAAQPETLSRDVNVNDWIVIPDNPKFSRFLDLNRKPGHCFRIILFKNPIKDTDDTGEITTLGFIADLLR